MALRVTTTLRIAIISALLAFVTDAAMIGYVRYTTQTSALADMRERVSEEAQALHDAVEPARPDRRERMVQQEINQADPDFLAGLFDSSGHQLVGNVPAKLPRAFLLSQSYEVVSLPATSDEPAREAGLIALRLDGSTSLVTGHRFGDALSLAHALERALVLALIFAAFLGGATGLAVAFYVNRRVRVMVRTIDGIGRGDFAMRLSSGGRRDGFDLLATQINLMLDRIDQLMKEVRLLTDSLAHDLRSPIGRLRTKVERALALDDEMQRSDLLNSALLDADALTRQLTTVLEIGRAESMSGTDRFEQIDPALLVRELGDLFEPVADEKGIAISVNVEESLPALRGHRQLLTQALGNLIDNAILHAGTGRSLSIFAEATGEGIALGVADRGPGIDPDQRAEARRRFGRLDASRSSEGAGLGLSLVEAVAHLHHGRLLLEDNQPGLRASLLLPKD